MPGVITHLVCAERYLRQNPRRDFKKFILGTAFPDIRYLAGFDRRLTHKKFSPQLNLSRLDSFKAGWKLHIFVDSRWSKLTKSTPCYAKYRDDKVVAAVAAKIIQDSFDLKKIDNLTRYARIIASPGSGTALSIPREKIRFFYSLTADYILRRNYRAYVRQIASEETIANVLAKISEMRKDKELMIFLSQITDKIMP